MCESLTHEKHSYLTIESFLFGACHCKHESSHTFVFRLPNNNAFLLEAFHVASCIRIIIMLEFSPKFLLLIDTVHVFMLLNA